MRDVWKRRETCDDLLAHDNEQLNCTRTHTHTHTLSIEKQAAGTVMLTILLSFVVLTMLLANCRRCHDCAPLLALMRAMERRRHYNTHRESASGEVGPTDHSSPPAE
jgi:hypothetical protein